MKSMIIGIMGCLVNCPNLGCVALTYSLLQNLEDISKKNNCIFSYIIFDEKPDKKSVSLLLEKLSIEKDRLSLGELGAPQHYNIKGVVRACTKQLLSNLKMIKDIKKCDVIIDMTGGDSFSDIYGLERFYKQTTTKHIVETVGIPLILGPQTFGPYYDAKVEKYAKKIISKAASVFSRDDVSGDYVSNLCQREVYKCTDMAFGLKYDSKNYNPTNKIRIGINPSGLLGSKKNEKTDLNVILKTDFDLYIDMLIKQLKKDSRYELHFIPHVRNEAIECFPDYNVIYHEGFTKAMNHYQLINGD